MPKTAIMKTPVEYVLSLKTLRFTTGWRVHSSWSTKTLSATTATMDPIPKENMGNATSLFNLVRNLGGSIGISAVETIQVRHEQEHLHDLGAHVNPLSTLATSVMSHIQSAFIAAGSSVYTAGQQAYEAVWGMLARQAAMMSYNDAFRLLGVLFFGMLPFILLMKKPSGSGDRPPVH